MWRVEQIIQHIVGVLSRLLDPVVAAVEWVDVAVMAQIEAMGVRVAWAERVVAGGWVLAVLLALRLLQGWWRVVALAVIVLVVGRLYGFVPRSAR